MFDFAFYEIITVGPLVCKAYSAARSLVADVLRESCVPGSLDVNDDSLVFTLTNELRFDAAMSLSHNGGADSPRLRTQNLQESRSLQMLINS